MTRRAYDPERIYTPPADPTDGLDLFAQRAAAPDVATETPAPRPVARAAMRGGRETAMERATPTMPRNRGRVYAIVQAHGPLTRAGIAEILSGVSPAPAAACNGVNGRVRELVLAKMVRVGGFDRDGCGLIEVVPPTEEDA